jgi:hypothetical protein
MSQPTADHIVSLKELVTFEGFVELSHAAQEAIADAQYNLIATEKGVNASRQERSLTEWLGMGGHRRAAERGYPELGRARIDALLARDRHARRSIRAAVASALQQESRGRK